MGIYQRDLTSFSEEVILHNSSIDNACVNCHSFRSGDPERFLLQVRSPTVGTPMLLRHDSKGIQTHSTKTEFSHGRAGFTAWHPEIDILAFSLNAFMMLHHSAAAEVRDVFDKESDIALYDFRKRTAHKVEPLSTPTHIETMPEWSPDGKHLYFCKAPQVAPEQFGHLRCDLMRIEFDPGTQQWGKLDTMLSARSVNHSVTQPRCSPDGAYILVTFSEYGDFPIHQEKSDLALITVRTSTWDLLPINSPENEAWHGWSSNGRWIVFSSKRIDSRLSQPFFSYFDTTGHAHKPFVLPQKDPLTYCTDLRTYTVPELTTSRVTTRDEHIVRALEEMKKRHHNAAPTPQSVAEFQTNKQ